MSTPSHITQPCAPFMVGNVRRGFRFLRRPTGAEMDAHAPLLVDGEVGYASWYPQMGGYIHGAIVMPDALVYVFGVPAADTEPFWDEASYAEDERGYGWCQPVSVSYDWPAQFHAFANFCEELLAQAEQMRSDE